MKRAILFFGKNIREMSKDPVGYIFVLGFPVFMLIIFAVTNALIQGAATADSGIITPSTTMFEMKYNAPAMALFGLGFISLTLTLQVSKDKSTALLGRLFTTPMKAVDYVIGYMLCGLALCLIQQIVCYVSAEIIGAIEGANADGSANVINFGAVMLSVLSQIPSMLLFVSLGILLGALMSDRSAPPVSSVVINAAGVLGGCYVPLSLMGGFAVFCKCLPFYPQLLASQAITAGEWIGFGNFWAYILITFAYAAAGCGLTVLAFSVKKKNFQI